MKSGDEVAVAMRLYWFHPFRRTVSTRYTQCRQYPRGPGRRRRPSRVSIAPRGGTRTHAFSH